MLDARQAPEEGDVRAHGRDRVGVALNEQRHAHGGRELHFAAQVAHGVDHLLHESRLGHGLFVELGGVVHGVGREHYAGFFVFSAHAGGHGDLLP